MSTSIGKHWKKVSDHEDLLGQQYRARTFSFTGSRGSVHSTLVNHLAEQQASHAILYIHGYTDYFFQTGLADHFVTQGYRFYALDLQGYGRSIRPNSPPNWCDSIEQYGQDLDIALATIKADGVDTVTLLAHSTGGLVSATYLAQPYSSTERASQYQTAFPEVSGLILNSPFLALPFSPNTLQWLSYPVYALVSLFPFASLHSKKASLYSKTLHQVFGGEWAYRLDWKPAAGYPLSFHWLKQIIRAQHQLAAKKITIPTLLCHSKISTLNKKTVAEMQLGDGVLDIDSMQVAAQKVFDALSCVAIEKGFHDLYLSHQPAREAYLTSIDNWLNRQQKES
ncbi:alpha/beta hydrolase [Marinomonas pollencensis]|uniref:Alpha-beta hydrolase superfamily lysophospholipase n=1 Tax=Marinomonas pollencensis TaxID=491954 RepID=A0A3E0DPY5_9GAMM|nr:alpha/beta hydrolase [Marinomonas pollencensis]REG84990.1 alpha-beta hydrolase superfamily lysophospholipase [Marinomonas pollencensis]